MGFWNKLIKNPLTYIMPGAGVVTSHLSNQKDKANAAIDSQMQAPGAAPQMLDPNDVGIPQAGGSAWSRMQRGMNAMDAGQAASVGRQGAYGQLAGARSELAARGGVDSGASERLAMEGMRNAGMRAQGVAGDLSRANMGTNIEDERLRRGAYNQVRQQNQLMQGQMYAGNQMANATLDASRPKGLLGLGFLGL